MNEITAPAPNIPLLRKAVEWAEAEAAKTDGLWHQPEYAMQTHCGTAYCIAGYAVMTAMPNAVAAPVDSEFEDGLELYIEGQPRRWGFTARRLLGLTKYEADALFEGWNTIEQVREVAEQIAARVGERL